MNYDSKTSSPIKVFLLNFLFSDVDSYLLVRNNTKYNPSYTYPVFSNSNILQKIIIQYYNQDIDNETVKIQNIPITSEISQVTYLYSHTQFLHPTPILIPGSY